MSYEVAVPVRSLAREAQKVPADVATYIREHRLTELDPAYTTRRLLLAVALYSGLGALGLISGALQVWCAAWFVMGLVMIGAGAVMHESVHRLLYRTRWLNDLAGAVAASLLFMPYEVYRRLHFAHHRAVSTADDPEPRFAYTGILQYLAVSLIASPVYLAIFWGFGLRALLGRPPAFLAVSGARRAVAINLMCLSAYIGSLIAATISWPTLLLQLLWIPLLVTMIVLVPLVTLPEHYGCGPGPNSAFVTTRTTTSNAILRWFFWNTNYHATHHLHPGVPSRRLPELHEVIKERCEVVEPSFIRWHGRLISDLVRRTLRRTS